MRGKRLLCVAGLSLALTLGATGCQDEGPAEEAGRKIDETVEDIQNSGEGALEKMGREIDEAVEESEEAAEEIKEAVNPE